MSHRFLALLSVPAALLAAGIGGCGGAGPPSPQRPVELVGEIRLPPGTGEGVPVHVSLYHAWVLQGELRHPLEFIESFDASPGRFTHRFAYPESGGEGLLVFAWADLDGDGVHCTMSSRRDLSGLAEARNFPADRVEITVALTEPCRGPEWFYPRPAAASTASSRP